jgi:hypothetical protein
MITLGKFRNFKQKSESRMEKDRSPGILFARKNVCCNPSEEWLSGKMKSILSRVQVMPWVYSKVSGMMS